MIYNQTEDMRAPADQETGASQGRVPGDCRECSPSGADVRKVAVRSHATDSDPELREPFSAAPRDCVKDRGHDVQ